MPRSKVMPILRPLFFMLLLLLPAMLSAQNFSRMEEAVLIKVNEYRAKSGLPELQPNKAVARIAASHSENMASGSVPFGHAGFDGRADQLQKKLSHMNHIAENVAYGQIDADRVVQLWLNSAGHRKNIRGNFNNAGVGIVSGNNGNLYFTMIFTRND